MIVPCFPKGKAGIGSAACLLKKAIGGPVKCNYFKCVSACISKYQLPICHCEPVTDVTGVAIRSPCGQPAFL